MVMVRHHNQGFVLNKSEKDLLLQEAVSLCELGAKGLVIGAITPDRKIDEEFISQIKAEISNKVDLTFHKASDETNLLETYDKLKAFDIRRVLTQGGKSSISQNSKVIKELLKYEGVTTLLGGGINMGNIQ
jgi:copper homeostasis protein